MAESGAVIARSYDTRRHFGSALSWLVVALGMLPLLAALPAPLQDWPNHVARVHVLSALLRGDPFWQQYYRLGTFVLPDVAVDLGLLGLTHAGLAPLPASACLLCATYLAFVAGFCALARAVGSDGPEKAAFAALLFYNAALFWGLVSYVLGVAAMMLALAAWLALPHRAVSRTILAAVAGGVLVFIHAVPAVVFPLLLACFDLQRFWRGRAGLGGRLAASLSWLASGTVVLAVLRTMPGDTGRDFGMDYAGGAPLAWVAWKARVFATVLLGGSHWQDGASILALLACTLAVSLGARVRTAAGTALAVSGLVALTLLAPQRLGSGSLLDLRLAILPLLLAAAGSRLAWRHRAALAVIVLAVLLRTAVIAGSWRQAGFVFQDFRTAAAQNVPAGSVMMMAYGTRLSTLTWQQVWSPPIESLATGIVARRVFFPALFANPSQQPIVLRAPFRALAQPWDMTDAPHRDATARAMARLCDGRFAGVYLTVLYPGPVAAAAAGAVLHAHKDFVLLDACRLVTR